MLGLFDETWRRVITDGYPNGIDPEPIIRTLARRHDLDVFGIGIGVAIRLLRISALVRGAGCVGDPRHADADDAQGGGARMTDRAQVERRADGALVLWFESGPSLGVPVTPDGRGGLIVSLPDPPAWRQEPHPLDVVSISLGAEQMEAPLDLADRTLRAS